MRFRGLSRLRQSVPGTALFVEMVSIVLAVLLALAVNEWRENRNITELVSLSLDGIRLEIEDNLEKVRQAHAYQGETLEIIRTTLPSAEEGAAQPDVEALLTKLYARDGGRWSPARPTDAAWKTAEVTGVLRHMPHDQVLLLARVYSRQTAYQEAVRFVREALSLVNFTEAKSINYLNGFYHGLDTVWWREEQLIEVYEEALAVVAGHGESGAAVTAN